MLRRAVRSETHKLLSRRTTCLLLVSLALLPPALAMGFAILLRTDVGSTSPLLATTLATPQDLLLIVFGTADLFAALLGLLSITSEYSTLTIMRTYQVFRRRHQPLIGKLISLTILTLATSAVAVGGAIAELLVDGGPSLEIQNPLLLASGFMANAALVALFGLGIGMMVSRTLPAVLTVVTFIYILPDVVSTLFGAVLPQLRWLVWYLPTEAAGASVQAALRAGYSGISPGLGLLVGMLETALVLVAGFWIQVRRDVV